MFKQLREKLAARLYEHQLTEWQDERDGYEERLQLARTYKGEPSSDLMLKKGEAVFAIVGGAALVEERRGPGHWEGSSSSVSIPIGSIGGRSVRYSAGTSRGHYVQGTSAPTAIDTGTVYVTNQRIIFQGGKQTRECLWSKLIGLQHDDKDGKTAFSASNRQKPLIIQYGPKAAAWFDFRLGLALAHYRETVPDLVTQLEGQLADLDARKPRPPAAQPESDGQPAGDSQRASDSSRSPGWWRLFRSLPRGVQIASWIGLSVLVLVLFGSVVGEESGASTTAPTSSPTTAPAAVALSPSPTTVALSPSPTTAAPRPTRTTAPAVSQATSPATAPPKSTTSPAAPPAATTCHPLTSGGNCYKPGQFCRAADHGASGVAGDGQKIVCKNNNGWRWEAV